MIKSLISLLLLFSVQNIFAHEEFFAGKQYEQTMDCAQAGNWFRGVSYELSGVRCQTKLKFDKGKFYFDSGTEQGVLAGVYVVRRINKDPAAFRLEMHFYRNPKQHFLWADINSSRVWNETVLWYFQKHTRLDPEVVNYSYSSPGENCLKAATWFSQADLAIHPDENDCEPKITFYSNSRFLYRSDTVRGDFWGTFRYQTHFDTNVGTRRYLLYFDFRNGTFNHEFFVDWNFTRLWNDSIEFRATEH